VLSIEDVWKRYGREWVLKGVSLRVAAGEAVALLGPNGVGKTTLLRVAATLTRPQRGRVELGVDRSELVYLANPPAFYRHLSGFENLKTGTLLFGRPVDRAAVEGALKAVGLPPDKPVAAYSSGMKKRLALARARLLRPRLLLLDEPETALDAEGRTLLLGLIAEVKVRGGAVLLATHDRAFAEAAADREVALS